MVVREPIVTIDDDARRLVWAAEGGIAKHYNASVQVSANDDGSSKVIWIAYFLRTAHYRHCSAMTLE